MGHHKIERHAARRMRLGQAAAAAWIVAPTPRPPTRPRQRPFVIGKTKLRVRVGDCVAARGLMAGVLPGPQSEGPGGTMTHELRHLMRLKGDAKWPQKSSRRDRSFLLHPDFFIGRGALGFQGPGLLSRSCAGTCADSQRAEPQRGDDSERKQNAAFATRLRSIGLRRGERGIERRRFRPSPCFHRRTRRHVIEIVGGGRFPGVEARVRQIMLRNL